MLYDFVDTLSSISETARNLASKLESGKIQPNDVEDRLYHGILSEVSWAQEQVENLVEYLADLGIDPSQVGNLGSVNEILKTAKAAVRRLYSDAAKKLLNVREAAEANVVIDDLWVYRYIDELDEQVYQLTGKHCAGEISNKLSSILQSLASCMHAVAEHLSKTKIEEKGKCVIVGDNRNGKGKKFCLTWSKAVEENEQEGLYSEADYENLDGWVIGNKVYLKLGDSELHKAVVDLEKGELKYSYSDVENKIMKYVFEKFAGLKCRDTGEEITCTGINDKNSREVALALSLAPSIYERIEAPEEYWSFDYREEGEKAMMLKRLEWLNENI